MWQKGEQIARLMLHFLDLPFTVCLYSGAASDLAASTVPTGTTLTSYPWSNLT